MIMTSVKMHEEIVDEIIKTYDYRQENCKVGSADWHHESGLIQGLRWAIDKTEFEDE